MGRRNGEWTAKPYWSFLDVKGDWVRLMDLAARTKSQTQFRCIALKAAAEGVLTRDLLTRYAEGTEYCANIRKVAAQALREFHGSSPSLPGNVWLPTVTLGEKVPALKGKDIAFARHLACVVTKRDPVPLTSTHTTRWSDPKATLPKLVPFVGKLIREIRRDAVANWTECHVRFDLRHRAELVAEDRSHELAATLALISASFDIELPPGTAAIGMVDLVDGGKVLSVGRPMTWIKVDGLVHSLPILSTVFVCAEDAEFVRGILPEGSPVRVVEVATIRELLKVLQVDPRAFRGRVRPSLLSFVSRGMRTSFDLAILSPGAIEDHLYGNRAGARGLVGLLAGEMVAVPTFMAAVTVASLLIRTTWTTLAGLYCISIFTIPIVLMLLLTRFSPFGGERAQRIIGARFELLERAGVHAKAKKQSTRVSDGMDDIEELGFKFFYVWIAWFFAAYGALNYPGNYPWNLAYRVIGNPPPLPCLAIYCLAVVPNPRVAAAMVRFVTRDDGEPGWFKRYQVALSFPYKFLHAVSIWFETLPPRAFLDASFINAFRSAWLRVSRIMAITMTITAVRPILALVAIFVMLVHLLTPLPRTRRLLAPEISSRLHYYLHLRRLLYIAAVAVVVAFLVDRDEFHSVSLGVSRLLTRLDSPSLALLTLACVLVFLFNLRRGWAFYVVQAGPSEAESHAFAERFADDTVGGYPVIDPRDASPKKVSPAIVKNADKRGPGRKS